MHRTGVEPMSIAWKATMLPLHQRCSHETLWLYDEKQSSCVKNWLTIGEKKCREKTLHQNNRQGITIASYGNRTHVNSLEGYYANTTPTMLTWTLVKIQLVTVLFCQKLIDDRRAKCRERERCTKTFTNGWQLHRTGIEPMSIAWKATMLPLHQRCSHLVIIHWETVLLCQKLIDDRREKVQRENAAPKQSPTDHYCIVRESTHVNSVEGYYATTTPTMLTWTLVKIQGVTVIFCQKLIDDRRAKCRERTLHQNIYLRMTIASYGNGTRVNILESYYATTTPSMLTWTFVIIQWETVHLRQKLFDNRRAKAQSENAALKQSPTDDNCIVREWNPCQ